MGSLLTAACCCNTDCRIDCDCLPSTVTIDYPAFTWSTNNVDTEDDCNTCDQMPIQQLDIAIPALTFTAYLCCDENAQQAFYRAVPINLADIIGRNLTDCCRIDTYCPEYPETGPWVCADQRAWLMVWMYADCTPSDPTYGYQGWRVGRAFIKERKAFAGCIRGCEECTTQVPHDLEDNPCAGVSFPAPAVTLNNYLRTFFDTCVIDSGIGCGSINPAFCFEYVSNSRIFERLGPGLQNDLCIPTGTTPISGIVIS